MQTPSFQTTASKKQKHNRQQIRQHGNRRSTNGPTVESSVRFREDLASSIGGMVDQAMFATCLSNDRRTAPTTTAIMSLLRTTFPEAATSAGTMKRAQLQMLNLAKMSLQSRPVIRIFGRNNTRTLTSEISRGPGRFSLCLCVVSRTAASPH